MPLHNRVKSVLLGHCNKRPTCKEGSHCAGVVIWSKYVKMPPDWSRPPFFQTRSGQIRQTWMLQITVLHNVVMFCMAGLQINLGSGIDFSEASKLHHIQSEWCINLTDMFIFLMMQRVPTGSGNLEKSGTFTICFQGLEIVWNLVVKSGNITWTGRKYLVWCQATVHW